ncbi:hypothetical protein [Chryseobacterium sp. c4a]|uniref:hypothetical protein n=1 Tax=Chryseobacterium sp. c4a TaxID=1573582 RepID=UPI0013591106|nr:hypothetical protein [Chryseobacterium sp. c4a]
MVEIKKGILDSFEVGARDSRNGKIEIQQDTTTYYIEVINNIIVTVSVQSLKEVVINGNILNFDNLEIFLKRENPFIDGEFYIFPEFQLSLYPDFKSKEFLQVLVYDKSLEDLYIKGLPKYNGLSNEALNISNELVFNPFESLGEFVFGISKEDFRKKFNISIEATLGVKGKEVISINPFSFRFYENKLTEVFLNCSKNNELKILFNNADLNDILSLEKLIKTESVIERKGHIVLPDLGLTVSKNFKDKEFFFYNKYLLQFWKNTNRPFTSW